eukprot:UN02201
MMCDSIIFSFSLSFSKQNHTHTKYVVPLFFPISPLFVVGCNSCDSIILSSVCRQKFFLFPLFFIFFFFLCLFQPNTYIVPHYYVIRLVFILVSTINCSYAPSQ